MHPSSALRFGDPAMNRFRNAGGELIDYRNGSS